MIYYLGVRFSKETNNLLFEFRKRNCLDHYPLPKLGFHCTIVHSKTPFKYLIQSAPLPSATDIIHENLKSLLKLYNTSLALKLDDSWLQDQHKACLHNGAKSDYDLYIPHITIAEDVLEKPIVYFPASMEINITEIFYKEWQ
jgi:hypothetical protein